MLSAFILTANSIVYSQITGISRDQKIEIVSTLEAYPLVLKELNLVYGLLDKSDKIIQNRTLELSMCGDENDKLLQINSNNEKIIDNLKLQLKSGDGGKWFVPALIGLLSGLVLGVVL